ncbi:MAG: antibiotic biosynthesis monooxygenase [Peptococcaceae bacterium]|nr:antibiotic biosynthesis monooxygenase [Peptococcaceae bacterium]
MIRVIAKNFIKSENISAAAPLFRELIDATRKESGCIEYRLFIDSQAPAEYVFTEEWASQEALDTHMKSEHFQRIIPQIGELSSKPLEVAILSEFS